MDPSYFLSLLFQAVRLLRVSANLEARANSLRQEALQCLTVALAGSDTKNFWSLMTAYFGTSKKDSEEDDPWEFLDAAPAIPEPLPLTETDTDDETTSIKSAKPAPVSGSATPASKPSGAAKRKPAVSLQKDLLDDLCSPKTAIRMYPSDPATLKETGIPPRLQVKREQCTTGKGASVYLCLHEKCQTPTFWAQSPAGLYSHVRRKHLGIVLACPYCADKLYWNSKGWKVHMSHHHRGLPAYRSALQNEAQLAQGMLATMEKKASKPPAKKRRRRTSPHKEDVSETPEKVEVKKEESPSESSGTQDSSSDSSTGSEDSDTSDADAPEDRPRQAPSELSDEQATLLMIGATSTVAEATTASLQKFPTSSLAPRPSALARRDVEGPPPPGIASAAAAFVLGTEDMPPLEMEPPAPFPEHAKSSSKCKKSQN